MTLSQSRGSVNEVIASSAFLGDIPNWPYFPTLQRLVLALAIGLFVGIERERRRKEAGLRTFAFTALLGAVGAMLGTPYALAALGLVGMLVVLLNVDTIHAGEGAEITTSAALLVVAFAGLLAGQGHTFTPTVLGVATAALLAWKQPLAGFSHTLTEEELGSAILLAILTFVVYPLLPSGAVDPWDLVDPRRAWMTVILIAGLGFANYILLKVYGTRGMEVTGFLGGLVNSTVTVTELVTRARETSGWLADVAYRSILLATGAMVVRNAVILGLLAPVALLTSLVPLGFMLAGAMAPSGVPSRASRGTPPMRTVRTSSCSRRSPRRSRSRRRCGSACSSWHSRRPVRSRSGRSGRSVSTPSAWWAASSRAPARSRPPRRSPRPGPSPRPSRDAGRSWRRSRARW